LLAQDDASIYVLSRTPLSPLFRINALDAYAAEFSPSSQEVVFYTPELRVETWNVAEESRSSVHEMSIREGCLQSRLSPDGKVLGCFTNTRDLNLYEVETGTMIFQKKDFYSVVSVNDIFFLLNRSFQLSEGQRHYIEMRFSPDAHYFVAGVRGETPQAVDLTTRKTIPLPGRIKSLVADQFVFLGPDRIVGVNPSKPEDSAIVRFPSGEELMQLPLGNQSLEAASHGNLLMLRPIKNYKVGVMDPESKKIILGNSEAAFDLYDHLAATERITGEIVLVDLDSKAQIAEVTLPSGPLGNLWAYAVSPDLNWLAVSEKTRGAVWNIDTNQRVFYVPGFRGAYFSNDGLLFADFPEAEKAPRHIGQLDLAQRTLLQGFEPEKEQNVKQFGSVLVLIRREGKSLPGRGPAPSSFDVLDAQTGKVLWSRDLTHGNFHSWTSPQDNTLVLDYPFSESAAADELKAHPEWSQRFANAAHEPTVHLMEIVDSRTGIARGAVLVDTNKRSFSIYNAITKGDWLVMSDNANRVLVYSISAGTEKGHIFGHDPSISLSSGMLEVENEPGQLILYDMATMDKRDVYNFSDRVVLSQFNADGKKLLVITAGQVAYLLDVTQTPAPAAAPGSADR
jgi:WD40 repeat protein